MYFFMHCEPTAHKREPLYEGVLKSNPYEFSTSLFFMFTYLFLNIVTHPNKRPVC